MDVAYKRVAIIGFARSGMAVAKTVLRLKGKPKISDSADYSKIKSVHEQWALKDQVPLEIGGHTRSFIQDSDLVVLSPGVRIDSEVVTWAREKEILVLGEVEFAWQLNRQPIVAITGSNGKTTVSTLTKEILAKSGKKVCLCGNIGTPFSDFVLDLPPDAVVVMEISSFQLESIIDFRPHVAVFTNFSQNHLDRHKDLDEYLQAKSRIFLNQKNDDYAVIDYTDPFIKSLMPNVKSTISFYNEPAKRKLYQSENPNFLAAMDAAAKFGVDVTTGLQVLREFKGVEHRLEWVRNLNGVDYINDSKATTVESGRWALQAIPQPIIMLCGGRDKHLDFSVLKEGMREKVKQMIVYGEAKQKLRNTFEDTVRVEEADSLEEAVKKAQLVASLGDTVLLCPMCTSFDMFKNYEERGKVFKEIVRQL
jgi:UDP-N-acetylmuramoylalanine--D-glutamate ligase